MTATPPVMPSDLERLICNYTRNDRNAINRFLGAAEMCGYVLTRADLCRHGWQSIESAPRDGTEILVLWQGKILMAKFNVRPRKDARGRWYIYHSHTYNSHVDIEPEAWRLLPPPPATLKDE